MKTTLLLRAGVCALLIHAQSALAAPPAQAAVSAAQMQALGIRWAPLQAQNTTLGASFPAQVVLPPDRERVVSAPAGGLLSRIQAQPNQAVRRGQPLLRITSPELGPQQARLLRTAAQWRLVRQSAARERELFREGIVPLRRVQEAEAGLSEATAALQEARAGLHLLGLDSAAIARVERSGRFQDSITVVAPASGVVLALDAKAGQRVAAADPLLRLGRLDRLWLEIRVPIRQARQWPRGTLLHLPNRQATARVISVSPAADPGSQTLTLRAQLEQSRETLRPGEFVQVGLPLATRPDAWDLPLSAVIRHQERAFVFVRTARGFEARPVQVLAAAGQRVRVRGPLRAGERVAVANTLALKAAWLGLGDDE